MNNHTETIFSNADPVLLREYNGLETEIEAWVDAHPNPLSADEHAELLTILSKRGELLSNIISQELNTVS